MHSDVKKSGKGFYRIYQYTVKTVLMVLCVFVLSGCGLGATGASATADSSVSGKADGKLTIITTIFPEYDWVRTILGDRAENVELIMLLDNGVDLHSYQPSAEDIMKISTCDMFVYVGGASENWVDAALAEAKNDDMIIIDMMEILGVDVKEEEIVEGMEAEEESEEGEEDEKEYDEHVWLSLRNAEKVVDCIADALCKLDEEGSETYKTNLENYKAELKALDEDYKKIVENASVKTVLFGDRFPFRYLVDDYSIKYYAAFAGCSAESEASFETIIFLAEKLDELGLKTIYTIENSDGKIAQTVRDNSSDKDREILVMNSMQSITIAEAESGVTYLSKMEENLEALRKGLQ